MKNYMTPSGLEPATFWFLAQYLKHCATAFPHIILYSPNFRRKKKVNTKCVLFSISFVWNISDYKKIWTKYYHKCTNVFMWSSRYACQILIKLEFSWQILKKIIQLSDFMKILPVRDEMFHAERRTDGRTDKHDKASSIFYNSQNAPKKIWPYVIFP
jgi:hypothetical protein